MFSNYVLLTHMRQSSLVDVCALLVDEHLEFLAAFVDPDDIRVGFLRRPGGQVEGESEREGEEEECGAEWGGWNGSSEWLVHVLLRFYFAERRGKLRNN